MRSIYEQSIGETDTIFRQSADRFADVLMGMREMAAEMQSQLDQTRNELKRGILELPQETAEATARCAASSSTRSRRWPNSTASSAGMAAVSRSPSRGAARANRC